MPEQKDEKIENSKDLRIIAAIGYLWILCLLPLLTKRNSEFAQHHGKQGLVLTIASFAIWLVAWFPFIGWLVGFFGSLIFVVLAVVGIMNALQGKYWEMPILGEYAKKIKI
jgi:uncharacterized membrane protein